jgi:hypothetical protein
MGVAVFCVKWVNPENFGGMPEGTRGLKAKRRPNFPVFQNVTILDYKGEVVGPSESGTCGKY